MSNESKGKRISEWITEFGVPVAIFGILVSIWTTSMAIRAQEEILERQNRVDLADDAYSEFLIDLLPNKQGVLNSRVPIVLYGSREVVDEFLSLKAAANDEDEPFQGSAELQKALLSFLNAIRVDVLGENQALSDQKIKAILSMQ